MIINNDYSDTFGKCLSLDDAIQCTNLDEFAYQEMMAFLPLEAHPRPARVLIVGGGDGGVARECLKHPLVEHVTQCEIDERVVELSKQHFPSMASSFGDPRFKLIIDDGYHFLLNEAKDASFDVIITDSSDPEGPAGSLFTKHYYELLEKKLDTNGIVCCQAESFWLDSDFILKLIKLNRSIFAQIAYASAMVCTYPTGQIGFLICSKQYERSLREPIERPSELSAKLLPRLRYYSPSMHRAAFALPRYLEDKFYGTQNSA